MMNGDDQQRPLFGDSHMHTPLCKHAHGDPMLYAEQALQRGLERIAITCHSPMPDNFWPEVRMDEEQLPEYIDMIERCRHEFEGRLQVLPGMEADFFPGTEDWMSGLLARLDLDHVLGSVHWQGPEYQDRYWNGSYEDFVSTYFDLLAASAESGLFDTLAHPDLIKNFQPELWHFDRVKPVIAAALDRIAAAGTAMEFNTSGRMKSSGEVNPSQPMLAMMAERGIPVVIGSDSHIPTRVADGFDDALERIERAGYSHVSLFRRRQRYQVPVGQARQLIQRNSSAAA